MQQLDLIRGKLCGQNFCFWDLKPLQKKHQAGLGHALAWILHLILAQLLYARSGFALMKQLIVERKDQIRAISGPWSCGAPMNYAEESSLDAQICSFQVRAAKHCRFSRHRPAPSYSHPGIRYSFECRGTDSGRLNAEEETDSIKNAMFTALRANAVPFDLGSASRVRPGLGLFVPFMIQ